MGTLAEAISDRRDSFKELSLGQSLIVASGWVYRGVVSQVLHRVFEADRLGGPPLLGGDGSVYWLFNFFGVVHCGGGYRSWFFLWERYRVL